jgi:hypothetical protein
MAALPSRTARPSRLARPSLVAAAAVLCSAALAPAVALGAVPTVSPTAFNATLPLCGAPFGAAYPECQNRVDWLTANWASVSFTQEYVARGVDGSLCSIQTFLANYEGKYCPACQCNVTVSPTTAMPSTAPSARPTEGTAAPTGAAAAPKQACGVYSEKYPECKNRLDWMLSNWNTSSTMMSDYVRLGVDGSFCSVQNYLANYEGHYCSPCDCSLPIGTALADLPPVPVAVPERAIVLAFFGICLGAVALCTAITVLFRRHLVMRSAQPTLMAVVLSGAALSSLSILFIAQYDSGDACMAQVWCFGIGFALMYGALVVKMRKIKLVFESKTALTQRSLRRVSPLRNFAVVAVIVLGEGAILAAWTLESPLVVTRVTFIGSEGRPLSKSSCVGRNDLPFILLTAGYHLVVLLYALRIAMQTSKLHTAFSEGKYLRIAIWNGLQFLIIASIVLFFTNETGTAMLVRGGAVTLHDITFLMLIFGPKLQMILFGSQTEGGEGSEVIRDLEARSTTPKIDPTPRDGYVTKSRGGNSHESKSRDENSHASTTTGSPAGTANYGSPEATACSSSLSSVSRISIDIGGPAPGVDQPLAKFDTEALEKVKNKEDVEAPETVKNEEDVQAEADSTKKGKVKVNTKLQKLGGGNKCTKCDKTVGFAELVERLGKSYHRECFCCSTCSMVLRQGAWCENSSKPYCKACHTAAFGPKGFLHGSSMALGVEIGNTAGRGSTRYDVPDAL